MDVALLAAWIELALNTSQDLCPLKKWKVQWDITKVL